MKYLVGIEEEKAKKFLEETKQVALKASCLRSKCGCVIVKNSKIISNGFNSPANGLESQRRCKNSKDSYNKKVTDKTCCMHAEQRAIMNSTKKELENSTLYFIRLDENDNISKAGKPYCTICSKMALDSGIKEFVLWHDKGICVYDTQEYNDLSYNYD